MMSSFHSSVLFLFHYSAAANTIQFRGSKARIQAGWSLETGLNSTSITARFGILPYNHFARITRKTQPLYFWECAITVPLHSNGNYLSDFCVSLPSRCLAKNVYYDFLGRHVTLI
jgi:hypothetical protein